MIEKKLTHDKLMDVFTNVINSSQSAGKLLSLANVLIPEYWLPAKIQGKDCLPMAERVLIWFRQNGFSGNRTKKNLYGYPGLFRDLFFHPNWVDMYPESYEDHRPFYLQSEEYGYGLLDTYRDYLEETLGEIVLKKEGKENAEELKHMLIKSSLMDLRKKIDLVSILGSERIESLYWATFEINPIDVVVDDFEAKAGAPDLFLWHPDPNRKLWFFAEVKGPADSLRHTQHEWFRENWETIQGHILIMIVT